VTDLDAIRRAVEGPAPVQAEVVEFGLDKTPTAEAVLLGRAGRGIYQDIDPAVLDQLADERLQAANNEKVARIEGYEQGLTEALAKAEGVRDGVLEIGLDIVDDWRKQKQRDPDNLPNLTKNQVDLLAHARLVGERIEDKVVPVGSQPGSTYNQLNMVALFAGEGLPEHLQ
jgi:hypothetical protein